MKKFTPGDERLARFNSMLTEADRHLFEAETLIDTFIADLFNEFGLTDFQIEEPVQVDLDRGPSRIFVETLYRDAEDGRFYIRARGLEAPLLWDEASITVKDLIINIVYLKMLSDDIYRTLRFQ